MSKTEFKDILVFLPGIGGSVLQTKDGKDLWAPSGGVLWRLLTRTGDTLERFRLDGDDPEREVLHDGIRAVRLVSDVHLIPGLWKIDGYSAFTNMVTEVFEVEQGSAVEDDGRVANYFEFPYDWRRGNESAARRLQRFLDERLHRWRKGTAFRDAKVILVAHSMGGLVARHYLEVLGGWQDCRALISMGTPYRGSVKALEFLANGPRVLFTRFEGLSEAVRSLPSVYQLLPRYEMVEVEGHYRRVAQTGGIPGMVQKRALDALKFHDMIDDAVAARKERGYELIPIVGTWQPTLQSARLDRGRLTTGSAAPTWTDFPPGEGDGTVPRVSAVPIEMSNSWLSTFVAERHATLQNHSGILQDLQDRLIQAQVSSSHIRGATQSVRQPALAIDLDDLYLPGEPIIVSADIRNTERKEILKVRAQIQAVSDGKVILASDFVPTDQGWSLAIPGLPAGAYRIEVTAFGVGGNAPKPVHDVFVV